MLYEVVLSPEAERQLQDLEDYLAKRFFPANAEQYIKKLTAACRSLAVFPYRGTKHDEVLPGLRTVGFEGRATIYFKIVDDKVFIISILFAGRRFSPDR